MFQLDEMSLIAQMTFLTKFVPKRFQRKTTEEYVDALYVFSSLFR